MKPYYADEAVTLYHGDCREVLAWLEADVLIMDPPYGTQFSDANPRGGYGRRQDAAGRGSKHAPAVPGMGAWIAGDNGTETRDEILSMWQARGPALVFGSPRMPDPPGEWADRLVWDKKRPGMNGGPWRYRHESIYVTAGFVRTSDAAVSIIEAWPDQKDHIHAKPIALMLRLVAAAPPGTIADPTTGAASTLVAAKQLGRKAIGVELDERYCEIAARRLDQGVLDFGATA
jgi:site-specific DNA-methyltransferase (adenine-specific)